MTRSLTARLMLAAAALVASATDAADLMLLERVAPTSGVVRLSDVAAILNATPDQIERLGRTPLMPAPASGAQQTIRAQSIRELLAAHGVDLSQLRFRGADVVVIGAKAAAAAESPAVVEHHLPKPRPQTGFRGATSAPTKRPPAAPRSVRLTTHTRQQTMERLASQLTQYVQHQTRDGMLYVMDVEIKDRNVATLAATEEDITISTTTALGVGVRRFLVVFDSPGGEIKFTVLGRVVEAQPAIFVRRNVPRGEVVTAADVHLAPLPLDYRRRATETLAASVDEVIGKEAATRLREGDVITDANCLPPVMVRRGDLVKVRAGRGRIRVSIDAKAIREGRLGETIEIESIDSGERFDARVVGRGKLAVLSAGAAEVQSIASDVETLRLR